MSVNIGECTLTNLRDALSQARDISDYLQEILAEKRHLLRAMRKLRAKHPELHPKNRAALDLKDVHRGGRLHRVGRRYVGMCRLLTGLKEEEEGLVENRLYLIDYERDIRRHVTADYEAEKNGEYMIW